MKYTPELVEAIKSMYSTNIAKVIAHKLGIPKAVVYRVAMRHGFRKPEGWHKDPNSGVFQKGVRYNPATEFKKGQPAHNKGKKVSPEIYKQMARTFFPPGHVPANHKPINTITIRRDKTGIAYKYIKISADKWELYHRYIWMQEHGPIPRGMVIIFKDGNSMNCDLSNLEMITMKDNMLRNSVANIPEDLREIVKLKNKLTKKIQEHGKKQAK